MEFSREHELVRALARNFAERELTDEVLEITEETGQLPFEVVAKMAKAGFFGIKTPVEYGGGGGDHISYVIVMEEICKVSAVAGVFISSPNSLSGAPILLSGTPEQKEKYVKPMALGEKIICFGLTEPGAGSDAGGMKTTAVLDGDEYVLNGRKTFITAAPISDYAIIYAKTDVTKGTKGISAFIVDMKSEGVSFGKPEEKMGIIGCPTSDIVLENVRVPKDCLLGKEGRGFINAMQTLDTGRIGIAAQSIGIAAAALEEATKFAKERKQFGMPIAKFQGIQFMLADMATKLEAARLLTYQAAKLKDEGKDASKMASMAKYFASEACNEICAKAVQIHGGYGFIKEYKVERLYRDARITTIYEGTSQVQQMVIAGNLLK
ncbi:acyl-CoA dehydrogenase family protein [Peptoniphilus sp. KCTC 25270]|uniref:acyl-CoA dehydrogenase family protein n=1 Tax=Peptoniphilus sp. KCTC 25270 TaxID=2897414 RepID=UPI001E53CF3E|nr:acyl-CoA dehydrogenase family protein [Peptoniphilus sp. KCTC 25270]MCD1147947.1 acyl-CoA dehydrogenase family protein [Peptoniphilus sp. KCTC 25270]